MSIINDNFMLKNEPAKKLYAMVKDLPIIDYHCHLSPKQIAENYQFKNAFDLFLGGDHYKWRQMRTNGVDEKFVTGDGDDYSKFVEFAKTVSMLIGNPLTDELFECVVEVAEGRETRNEQNDYREISIFKDGVTL